MGLNTSFTTYIKFSPGSCYDMHFRYGLPFVEKSVIFSGFES